MNWIERELRARREERAARERREREREEREREEAERRREEERKESRWAEIGGDVMLVVCLVVLGVMALYESSPTLAILVAFGIVALVIVVAAVAGFFVLIYKIARKVAESGAKKAEAAVKEAEAKAQEAETMKRIFETPLESFGDYDPELREREERYEQAADSSGVTGYCPECGVAIRDAGQRYCSRCGAKLARRSRRNSRKKSYTEVS